MQKKKIIVHIDFNEFNNEFVKFKSNTWQQLLLRSSSKSSFTYTNE